VSGLAACKYLILNFLIRPGKYGEFWFATALPLAAVRDAAAKLTPDLLGNKLDAAWGNT
jgi:hypothetical protein